MGTSLVECVLAMVLGALLFAGAVIPTTQALAGYQKAEAALRAQTAQNLAAARLERIFASVWREAMPPADTGSWLEAKADQARVGSWRLRQTQGRLEQRKDGLGWAVIAASVKQFKLEYLPAGGTWKNKIPAEKIGDVLAVRFQWTDAVTGRAYGGWAVPTDRLFAQAAIQLPAPDLAQPTYNRSNYAQTLELPLGSWK